MHRTGNSICRIVTTLDRTGSLAHKIGATDCRIRLTIAGSVATVHRMLPQFGRTGTGKSRKKGMG